MTSERHRRPLGGAAVAHGLAALAAVVLAEADLLLVVHGPQVPEEGPVAQLTGVGLGPVGTLY